MLPDSLPGLRPWTPLGTSVPQTPCHSQLHLLDLPKFWDPPYARTILLRVTKFVEIYEETVGVFNCAAFITSRQLLGMRPQSKTPEF